MNLQLSQTLLPTPALRPTHLRRHHKDWGDAVCHQHLGDDPRRGIVVEGRVHVHVVSQAALRGGGTRDDATNLCVCVCVCEGGEQTTITVVV